MGVVGNKSNLKALLPYSFAPVNHFLEKHIFNGLVCRRIVVFDRIYRILGISFLSPFPDERVKTNPPVAEEGLVLAQLLSEVFPGPMSKLDFRSGQDLRQLLKD